MSEFSKYIKKPMAVTSAALAGLAFTGCGGGDKKIDFGVLCQKGTQLRVIGTDQPSYSEKRGTVTVSCEDSSGNTESPKSIQLAKLAGGNAVSANFKLTVKVDQEGDATWNNDTMASYDLVPGESQADIYLDNADKIEEVSVKTIADSK